MKTPKNSISLTSEVPDYSSGPVSSPATKDKNPKMKKVHPVLVVKNQPALHKQMKLGKKYHAHVIVSPSLIRTEEGKGQHSYPGDESGGHHMELNVHSIAPMGEAGGSTSEPDGDEPPDFGALKHQ